MKHNLIDVSCSKTKALSSSRNSRCVIHKIYVSGWPPWAQSIERKKAFSQDLTILNSGIKNSSLYPYRILGWLRTAVGSWNKTIKNDVIINVDGDLKEHCFFAMDLGTASVRTPHHILIQNIRHCATHVNLMRDPLMLKDIFNMGCNI